MKINLNIEKRYAYVLIVLLIILIGVLVVGAYTSSIPNPGHGGDTIWISVGGSEKTLQQAIDAGDFDELSNIVIGNCIYLSSTGRGIPPTNCQHCGSWYTNTDARCPEDYPLMTTAAFDVINDNTNNFRITCCQLLVDGEAVSYTPAF